MRTLSQTCQKVLMNESVNHGENRNQEDLAILEADLTDFLMPLDAKHFFW